MKAVAYQAAHALGTGPGLQDIRLPVPEARGRDLLVAVKAVSVNPVDTKVRAGMNAPEGGWKVLGWDAAGVVEAVGPDVTTFKPGDRVWYAGDLSRPGSNAEFQLVDERIVGLMPATLDFAEAAALPLTGLTAWELLFERLAVAQEAERPGQLLVVGAAGGVGSILVQLARRLTGLTVIGTASRPESRQWLQTLGAHHVIDHAGSLSAGLKETGLNEVTHVASLNQTERHFAELVASLAPQGKLGLIDDPSVLDVTALKRKSLSLHWEFMFTRSLFGTPDLAEQGRILNELARLIDAGVLRTTLARRLGPINAASLNRAHAELEGQRTCGKLVLEGFA
ncbi:zinc-binding alcohol dehydrogenase family protein [Zobellella sp. DQSA1]|uniref:zinc-binding alcohol dehydrogenase family protein n=1 Tax=Zobellella sp. DQSA1 TaxID=3342386 RepID=UPI0035BEDE0C